MATDNRPTGKRDNTMAWVLAGAVFLGILGLIIWSMNDSSPTASNTNTDTNTSSASRTAPAPGDPQAPLPGNPARP
jgi:hypothetical protein